MCIDKLHISFSDYGIRSLTLGQRATVEPDPRHPDFQGVVQGIVSLGYEIEDIQEWERNGIVQYKLFVHGSNGQRNAMMIRGAAYNINYMRIVKIECNPSSFGSYAEFRRLLDVINEHSYSNIFRYGQVVRIDYALDYRVPFYPFVRGLYYQYAHTVLAYADADDPFEEYTWEVGLIRSFRIGRDRKIIKIYDKGLEEWKSRRKEELRRRREHPELRPRVIADPQPRSRIEVSLTQRSVISAFWGEGYHGMLGELERHIGDITAGRRSPFRAVLMNNITTRQSRPMGFEVINNLGNQRLKLEIESGFLNVVYKRMTRQNFWEATRNVCAIMPWNEQYQPHRVYRNRLYAWVHRPVIYDPDGETMPARRYWGSRIQNTWPMHLAGVERTNRNTATLVRRPRIPDREAN